MYFLDYAIKLRPQIGLFYSCRVCGLLFGSCVPGQGTCVDKEQLAVECHPDSPSLLAQFDKLIIYYDHFFPTANSALSSLPKPMDALSRYPCIPAAQAAQLNEFNHEPPDKERVKQAKRESVRRSRAKNPEKVKQINRESVRLYRAKNPERVKQSNRKANRRYRERNPEKAREACRRYRAKNPEKVREANRRYRGGTLLTRI